MLLEGKVGRERLLRENTLRSNVCFLCCGSGEGPRFGFGWRSAPQDAPVGAPHGRPPGKQQPCPLSGIPQCYATARTLSPHPPQGWELLGPPPSLLRSPGSHAGSRKTPRWWLPPHPSSSLPVKWVSQQLGGLSEALSAKAAMCARSRGSLLAARNQSWGCSPHRVGWGHEEGLSLRPTEHPGSLSGLPPSQAGPMGRAHVLEGASVISSRCLLLTVRLWASYLTFLCSVFFSLKWGKNTTYLTGKLHG